MELQLEYGVAAYIKFILRDANGDPITSATGLDSEFSYWEDALSAPSAFEDCTNEASEDGSTGTYALLLTTDELAHNHVSVQVKSNEAKTFYINIQTFHRGYLMPQ